MKKFILILLMTNLIINASHQGSGAFSAVPTQATESNNHKALIQHITKESLEATRNTLHSTDLTLNNLGCIICICPCLVKGILIGAAEHNLLQAKTQSIKIENAQKALAIAHTAMQIDR